MIETGEINGVETIYNHILRAARPFDFESAISQETVRVSSRISFEIWPDSLNR